MIYSSLLLDANFLNAFRGYFLSIIHYNFYKFKILDLLHSVIEIHYFN